MSNLGKDLIIKAIYSIKINNTKYYFDKIFIQMCVLIEHL